MRAKMESDEVLTWDDRCIYIYQARDGRSMQIARSANACHLGATGPTCALRVGAMTATRRLASGQMLGNREIAQ